MHQKIKHFCSFFKDFKDCYTLIGGAACTIWYIDQLPNFRATRDVDIVLILENLDSGFTARFHQYMKQYEYHGTAIGMDELKRTCMYRLQSDNPLVPPQIEILSRRPEESLLPLHLHSAPLKVESEYTYLSCILMNDEYYDFLKEQIIYSDDIPLPKKAAIIALKIKAYLNIEETRITATKEDIEQRKLPNEEEMNKHRNDVFFLLLDILPNKEALNVPQNLTNDIQAFVMQMQGEDVWNSISQSLMARRKREKEIIKTLSSDMMLGRLKSVFHLND